MKIGYIFIIVYSILSFSAFTLTFIALYQISRGGINSNSTKLVFFLQITLLIKYFCSIPFIYNGSSNLCQFISFLNKYAGLSNSITIFLMIINYRYIVIEDTLKVTKFINKKGHYLIFFIPLITLLPFTTKSYEDATKSIFCHLDNIDKTQTLAWQIFVFYLWVAILSFSSLVGLISTTYNVYILDRVISSKIFLGVGLYTIISVIYWVSNSLLGYLFFPDKFMIILPFIVGILYFFLYLREKSDLEKFESFFQNYDIGTEERNVSWISWEDMLSDTYSADGNSPKPTILSSPQLRNSLNFNSNSNEINHSDNSSKSNAHLSISNKSDEKSHNGLIKMRNLTETSNNLPENQISNKSVGDEVINTIIINSEN